MTGYRQLERQLLASVRERGTSTQSAPPPKSRQPRRRPRRGLAVAVAALVVGAGVATASQLVPKGDEQPAAKAAAAGAIRETAHLPACRTVNGDGLAPVIDRPVQAQLHALFPAGPTRPEDLVMARTLSRGAAVIAGTPRLVSLPDAGEVLLYLSTGPGPFTLSDPSACAAARQQQLARDRPDPKDSVRQQAEAILGRSTDTEPAVQSLNVQLLAAHHSAGTAVPIARDAKAPVGLALSSEGTYVGVAAPGAAQVVVDANTFHRTVPIRQGLFAISLPKDVGRVAARHLAADGHVLYSETIGPGDAPASAGP
jgi:hypothetical protein